VYFIHLLTARVTIFVYEQMRRKDVFGAINAGKPKKMPDLALVVFQQSDFITEM